AYNRLSILLDERACSSDSEFASSSFSLQKSPRLSPIYAQPYAAYPLQRGSRDIAYVDEEENEFPNMAASFTYIPCADYRPVAKFCAPPPPPCRTDFDRAEMDFLAELDAQIAELQVRLDCGRLLCTSNAENFEKTTFVLTREVSFFVTLVWSYFPSAPAEWGL
uniref:Uncharacterized protein n=1 Tax=Parascaris univalens TaxID=6257 RepID=A0A915AZH9_PARUN